MTNYNIVNDFNLNYKTGDEPAAGKFLISEPFMGDKNFSRSVVLICEHEQDLGTFGLVLNKELDMTLKEAVPELVGFDAPLFFGGPVQQDTLHFIHKRKDLFEDCGVIQNGVYWSGDFDKLKYYLNGGQIDNSEIRFFLGYSGWDDGQLQEELAEASWIISSGDEQSIFELNPRKLWRSVLQKMGGTHKVLSHFPEDPMWN